MERETNRPTRFFAADGRLEIDMIQNRVRADGEAIDAISPSQLRLLGSLASRLDTTVGKAELSREVVGHDDVAAQESLRVHVYHTRRNLPPALGDKTAGAIRTDRLRGGYSMVSSLSIEGVPSSETELVSHLADGRVVVDHASMQVKGDGELLNLTPIQRRIMDVLARRPNRLINQLVLRQNMYPGEKVASRGSLPNHIFRIRKALGGELGDAQRGVIRQRKNQGYGAVSSLKVETLAIDEGRNRLAVASRRLVLDPNTKVATVDRRPVELFPRQFDILHLLARHADMTIDPVDIGTEVWGNVGVNFIATVKVHIHRIRHALGKELGNPKTGAVRTDFKKGYRAVSSLGNDS